LYSNVPGDYVLFSAVQRDTGPPLFSPFFGFAHKGLNTQVTRDIGLIFIYAKFLCLPTRVARFFSMPKNIPNNHKIYQIITKHTK
jgi:hypothetical protein